MEQQKTELIFAKGISVFKPREGGAPSVKANLVISLKELLAFAKEHNLDDTVRIDLRKSEAKQSLYLTLNTWKPTRTESPKPDISKPTVDEEGNPMQF